MKREIPRVQSGLNQLQNVAVILFFNCLSMFCNNKEVNEGRLCHVDSVKADKSCANVSISCFLGRKLGTAENFETTSSLLVICFHLEYRK